MEVYRLKAFSPKRVLIPVGARGTTSGLLAIPGRYREGAAVVVAHGAGNDMESPLIASFAEGLADAGYLTLRFNFLYRDRGMKTPDDEKTLVETWQAVHRYITEEAGLPVHTFIAAGKSLGGRIASRMVSAGLLSADRLIFLGYPLHPPQDRGKLRDAHLYTIGIPMLFFAGTRDPLCDLDLLKSVLVRIKAPWKLCTIEGGDHSFQRQGGSFDLSVHDAIVHETILWLQEGQRVMKGKDP